MSDDEKNSAPDLDALRLTQDLAANLGVKKRLVQLPVRKPHKQWFVRVRPGDDWRAQVALIRLREVNETYVVVPSLVAYLPEDVDSNLLVLAIDRNGSPFLRLLRTPKSSGDDPWAYSALEAAKLAETSWVRVTANMQVGAYDVAVATGALPEPEWPEESLRELFKLAFRDRVIDSLDHPVIRRLKGAV